MKSKFVFKSISILLSAVLLLSACTDESWNDHYYAEVSEKSDLNLYDYLKSQPELSTFTQMIDKLGLDTLLSASQTFSVFAPDNAALASVDMNNTDLVEKIVLNHLTLFTVPTANILEKKIMMLNGKILTISKTDGQFYVQGFKLSTANIAVKNGVVHKISGYVPYIYNIWEYIQNAEGLDSLRNYVNSLSTLEFNAELSYVDGVLVDSVMTMNNKIISYLAKINNENYQYNALLPNNTAWAEAFAQIYPHYKAVSEDGGAVGQLDNTRWTIVKDLFVNTMEETKIVLGGDSVESTYGTQFSNQTELYAGAGEYTNSNGKSYISSSLKFNPTEWWFKPIKVEAEYTGYGRISGNYKIYDRNSYGSGMNVSSNKYIYAESTTTLSTARLFVNFPIPNTLKGKYNVYAVLVPTYISDTTNQKVFRLRFSLNYDYGVGNVSARDSVWVNSSLQTVRGSYTTGAIFQSEPKTITKMKVLENYEFANSNLYNSSLITTDFTTSRKIRVGLRVENAAGNTAADKLKYNRNIGIDCIILEPVIE